MPRDWDGVAPIGGSAAVVTADAIAWGTAQEGHAFKRISEQHYQLEIPEYAAVFDLDRLWRDRHELCGELVVTCTLKGARGFDGAIYSGHVNLSSPFRRRDVCTRLKDRANTKSDVDWDGALDELAARVTRAERDGRPARVIGEVARPQPDEVFNLEGWILPKNHPSILFGDGGTFKSFLSLYFAGWLGQMGLRVLYCDWELEIEDHRERLERLFGADMPRVHYQRMYRPMRDEIDGIRRAVERERIDYVICDSVAFATAGAPESAEAAMEYFRCIRELGVGSLHLAHVVKAKEDAPDPTRPFGSTFWHNAARSTWSIKRAEDSGDGRIVVGLQNRKTNLGPFRPPVAFEVEFTDTRTFLHRRDMADVDEFASSLPTWQRMRHILQSAAPMTYAQMADEAGYPEGHAQRDKFMESMRKEVGRKRVKGKLLFVRLVDTPDGVQRIALASDREAPAR